VNGFGLIARQLLDLDERCLPIRMYFPILLFPVKSNNMKSQNDRNRAIQALLETADKRLHPSLTGTSYLVLRARRTIFSKWISQLGGENLTVLDIGGRYQPYRPLLGNRVARYIAIDLNKTDLVDVVADGEALPFAPEVFDLVIATQVMEYFQEPNVAIKQIHAVLKPGGVLLASVAACAPRFVEDERWRFTRPGLRTLLSEFAKVEIIPELYSVGSVVRTMNLAFDKFARFESARWVYRRTACPLLNVFGLAVEKLNLTSNDEFTANYSVLAVRGE
jgi:SAM-dependent methyltransferase